MAIPYPYTSSNVDHINTGSYLNQKETQLFLSGYGVDAWYGLSETDVIEVSAFDLDQNQLGWATINTEKNYKPVTLSYLDEFDRPMTYSYRELVSDFILYKNSKILVNPSEQLSASFGILQGSYILTYNFIREMAGSPSLPLVVKDISPSRKEIKLVTKGNNTARYQAFCHKKFQVKDVAPLLLQLTSQCPYDQIYARLKNQYANEIAFLKQLLFLDTDGAFIAFLRTLYEDIVVYTASGEERIKRTQGIRGYYQNFLLSHYETISDFILIDDEYDKFTVLRVDQQFKSYGVQTGENFIKAKKFLVNFFTENFYHPITLSTKTAFDQKYYSYFKNALNLGNNQMFTILDHAYMDEKIQETDPLTLLLKLKDELPDTVKVQTECWVSNISIAPFVVKAIVRNPAFGKTVKIGSANFTLEAETISLYNVNESYTANDLRNSSVEQQNIDINKKINELPVDYTNFSNFIVFSSATQRLANFKKKTSTWYMLSSSLVALDYNSSQYLSSGNLYPQYSLERGSLEAQMSDIITSFDGYESYLFKTGSYTYDAISATFVSSSYVSEQDFTASLYDRTNRDSLLNNTPAHIILDEGNNDYLMFLNMIGHFFDNIYLYINNLPSEKSLENDPTKTFSKKMVDYMLDSFGWKIGNTDENLSMVQTYTANVSSSMSANDRTQAIRTRILNTLPEIYKTKGTEDAIKLLLACYGIPSNLLDVREYGNNDYTTASLVTYTKRERACMFVSSGSGIVVSETFALRPDVRTIEFKLAFNSPERITPRSPEIFASCGHTYNILYDYNWTYHNQSPLYISLSIIPRGWYSKQDLPAWEIGYFREYGNMGRIYAKVANINASVYSRGQIGTLSGSFDGTVITANGVVASSAIFTSSYFFGTIDGGPLAIVSGSVSGSNVSGLVTGSITTHGTLQFDGELSGANIVVKTGTFNQTDEYLAAINPSELISISNNPENGLYLTSSLLPLFDGGIFNVRLRRNEPDPAYQYAMNEQTVPVVYDLTVQRNEAGRKIFRSMDSVIGHYNENMAWDGISTNDVWETTGSLGTTTTSSILFGDVSYDGNVFMRFGNAMVWDVPISDSDFEIHCNDYSSFSYSGSDGEKHLITRIDADEVTNFATEYCYQYLDYTTNLTSSYGYTSGRLENKSEYYSTYVNKYNQVYASGSWTGAKTGSLYSIEKFTGSLSGIVSGSISGSGEGRFVSRSFMHGQFTGSMAGTFNGIALGQMTSSTATASGLFGQGVWNGTVLGDDIISQSVFTGSFSGQASGSFFGIMFGQCTSSKFGTPVGYFSGNLLGDNWTGQFTGSITGSIRGIYMTGSFNGSASGSQIFVQDFGSLDSITTQIWYGSLTGSLNGSFTGSSGQTTWTGSTFWIENYGGFYYSGQALFSGSMKGVTTSSIVEILDPSHTATYSTGMYSGSFLQIWTGSPVLLYNKPVMPTDIVWYSQADTWTPINPIIVAQESYCNGTIVMRLLESGYPYQYSVEDIEKTFTTPNYGPNRYKNEKIKPNPQTVATRLDDKDRSTYNQVQNVHADSNLLGLYLDPQDAKNRDIVKYYGNNNLMGLIADPSNMFSASYGDLKELNEQYNSFGDRRVLYNELITLYKIYFNRSIFDTVKNVVPARANVRTGILVEPTVLERPKYQHHQIVPEINTGSVVYYDMVASHYAKGPVSSSVYGKDIITKILRFHEAEGNTSNGKMELLYGEFNNNTSYVQTGFHTASLPANLTIDLDLSYVNEANFIYSVNYGGGYIPDLTDNIQHGHYASLGEDMAYPGAVGVTTSDGNNFTFMVKKWDKYTIYSKSGSYVRNSNKTEDVYLSHSIWLYSLTEMSPDGYATYFYTASKYERSGSSFDLTDASNLAIIDGVPSYFHRVNTAKNTSNERINTIRSGADHISSPYVLASGSQNIADQTYFEVFGGYPRNHYTHKRMQYSPVKFSSFNGKYKTQTPSIYVRSRQTVETTIDDKSGLGDASLPIQTIQTSNVNLIKSDNVINQ